MDGAQPATPGSGGTPTDMVAVPGPGQALLARSTGFGGTLPGMTAKIALRGGNQEAFRRWIANRNDVITANGLDQLMDNNQMPTLEAVGERFPGLSSEQKQAATERALLLQQKCKRVGGYDFRRTGRSGGGQGVRTVREQALVRGAGRTARAPHR